MSDDTIDPVLFELLAQLWSAAISSPKAPWSLAKLSKQSQMQMSTLRRHLTHLTDEGIVEVLVREDGSGCAKLTPMGRELCIDLFTTEG